MIRVSVIVTIYNGEKYLKECLESIVNQSLTEIEIICVDDASDDKTPDILEEYKAKDSRIKVITNAVNRNAGASRNIGLREARGIYVIFLDADDLFELNMLKKSYWRAVKSQADICIFKEEQVECDSGVSRKIPYAHNMLSMLGRQLSFCPMDIREVIFNLWNGWAWDKVFRREFIIKNKLFFQELKRTNDVFFVHTALVVAEKITFLDEILVRHRIKNENSLSNKINESWDGAYIYLKELQKYLRKHNLFERYEKSYVNWAVNFLYWNYSSIGKENRRKMFCELKQDVLKELNLFCYSREVYYNPFYYEFIQEICNKNDYDTLCIPICSKERWRYLLAVNKAKMSKLWEYLRESKCNVGIWGAGERGKIFLKYYGRKAGIKKVFDSDNSKFGMKINNRYEVDCFDKVSGESIEILIVTNACYYDAIVKKVKEIYPQITVLDLDSYLEPYLSFPLKLEDCIL